MTDKVRKIIKTKERGTVKKAESVSLAGKCLVAVPGIEDVRFDHSLIFMCACAEEGAMGLVINRPLLPVKFDEFVSHLNIKVDNDKIKYRPDIIFGGPVESTRGFVIHSADYFLSSTLSIKNGIAITSTLDILGAIAVGRGPKSAMVALGYASWEPGQLEEEMKGNTWLVVDADEDLIFNVPFAKKWNAAMERIGVDPSFFALYQGNA